MGYLFYKNIIDYFYLILFNVLGKNNNPFLVRKKIRIILQIISLDIKYKMRLETFVVRLKIITGSIIVITYWSPSQLLVCTHNLFIYFFFKVCTYDYVLNIDCVDVKKNNKSIIATKNK